MIISIPSNIAFQERMRYSLALEAPLDKGGWGVDCTSLERKPLYHVRPFLIPLVP
jgi:hypothetical protein